MPEIEETGDLFFVCGKWWHALRTVWKKNAMNSFVLPFLNIGDDSL